MILGCGGEGERGRGGEMALIVRLWRWKRGVEKGGGINAG